MPSEAVLVAVPPMVAEASPALAAELEEILAAAVPLDADIASEPAPLATSHAYTGTCLLMRFAS